MWVLASFFLIYFIIYTSGTQIIISKELLKLLFDGLVINNNQQLF